MAGDQVINYTIPALLNEEMEQLYNRTKEAIGNNNVFVNLTLDSGRFRDTYKGVLENRYAKHLDPLLLAMLVTNGYSFFGGSVSINRDNGEFRVEVYND